MYCISLFVQIFLTNTEALVFVLSYRPRYPLLHHCLSSQLLCSLSFLQGDLVSV